MTDQQSTADHWWWRPGWSVGRRFLTWHLTFDHASEVHRLAEAYRQRLAPLPGLDLIPDRWLHLTMQGLGFVDEVAQDDVDAIVAVARAQLALVAAFEVTIDRPTFTPEAIRWEAAPGAPVEAVRDAIRTAVGTVWAEVPERREGFGPHISIAYSRAELPAAPVLAAIAAEPSAPARVRIASAELILLGRDNHMYEWETVASVSLA
jgi:2'-5' RNA ligase